MHNRIIMQISLRECSLGASKGTRNKGEGSRTVHSHAEVDIIRLSRSRLGLVCLVLY